MKKIISLTAFLPEFTSQTAIDFLKPHLSTLSENVTEFVSRNGESMAMMLNCFRASLSEQAIVDQIKVYRFWDSLMPFEVHLGKIHFYMPDGKGVGCPLIDAKIVMHVKPETVGCKEASAQRFNMTERKIGAPEHNECKMLVFRAEKKGKYTKDTIVAVALPGDITLDSKVTKEFKLGILGLEKLEAQFKIIPYTVNPFDLSEAISRQDGDKKSYIFVARDQFPNEFITNNCGSRVISLSVQTQLYFDVLTEHLTRLSRQHSTDKAPFEVTFSLLTSELTASPTSSEGGSSRSSSSD